jgi:hypothetical protein
MPHFRGATGGCRTRGKDCIEIYAFTASGASQTLFQNEEVETSLTRTSQCA